MTQIPSGTQEITVGQLAARSGVSVSALHFYEAQGLISARRTAGNQRRYPREMLRRVAFIRASQRVGIPLSRIRDALGTLQAGRTPTPRDWARLSAAWRHDLDDRISQLQHLRDRLTGCIGCGCLSLTGCQARQPGRHFGQRGARPPQALTRIRACRRRVSAVGARGNPRPRSSYASQPGVLREDARPPGTAAADPQRPEPPPVGPPTAKQLCIAAGPLRYRQFCLPWAAREWGAVYARFWQHAERIERRAGGTLCASQR